jgi:DNA-binding NarL/FixJ family response regulator
VRFFDGSMPVTVSVHRIREAMQLVGETHEIGVRTEAARQHVVAGMLEIAGAAIGGGAVDHFLGSIRRVTARRAQGIAVMRERGDRPFSEEDRELLHLVHMGIGPAFGLPSPRDSLAPRVRATLDCLLLGAADKEIAVRLGLSPHTVRGYVKAIYRAYEVNGRAELIVRSRLPSWR